MDLKHEITSYYIKNEARNGKEETFNVLEVLSKYDDNVMNIEPNDSKLFLRLMDDPNLHIQIEMITLPDF